MLVIGLTSELLAQRLKRAEEDSDTDESTGHASVVEERRSIGRRAAHDSSHDDSDDDDDDDSDSDISQRR